MGGSSCNLMHDPSCIQTLLLLAIVTIDVSSTYANEEYRGAKLERKAEQLGLDDFE